MLLRVDARPPVRHSAAPASRGGEQFQGPHMAPPKNQKSGSADAGGMRIDPTLVRELAQLLTDNELTEIEVADGDRRIKVKREPPATIGASLPAAAPALSGPPIHGKEDFGSAEAEEVGGETIKSPMVGTAFLSPEPGA